MGRRNGIRFGRFRTETGEAPYGTKPCNRSQASAVPAPVSSDVSPAPTGRFLRWASSALPATYGQFPDGHLPR